LRLMHARDALVRARTGLVNDVRGSVKALGMRMPSCDATAFHKAGAHLPDDLRPCLEPLLHQIVELTALVRGNDEKIEERASADPAVMQVTQVSGVGALTGLAYVAAIEDPNRFPQRRKIGSYLGLWPKLDQSGKTDKRLG
jgi:transposase